jgi:hypothetical protein
MWHEQAEDISVLVHGSLAVGRDDGLLDVSFRCRYLRCYSRDAAELPHGSDCSLDVLSGEVRFGRHSLRETQCRESVMHAVRRKPAVAPSLVVKEKSS